MNVELKIKTQDTPLIEPNDPGIRVIIGHFYRDKEAFPAEACLDISKKFILWEIHGIGNYQFEIEFNRLTNSEKLDDLEVQKLILWSNEGLDWLFGI